MEIFDPIHGNIIIDDLSKSIIDTEAISTINIKQLGLCYYVFPFHIIVLNIVLVFII